MATQTGWSSVLWGDAHTPGRGPCHTYSHWALGQPFLEAPTWLEKAPENERKILYAGKCPKRHFLETSSCVFLFLRAQMALRRDKHKGCESAVTGPCRDRDAEQQTREASALRHCITGPESPGPTCGPRAGLQRGSHTSAPGRQPHAFTPAHHASGLAGHITVTR